MALTYSFTETVTETMSWSVSSSTKVTTDTITTTYGATNARTATYKHELKVTEPADAITTISFTPPVIRYYGTWVVSYDNTTVYLFNTYSDYPAPAGSGEYLILETPLA